MEIRVVAGEKKKKTERVNCDAKGEKVNDLEMFLDGTLILDI